MESQRPPSGIDRPLSRSRSVVLGAGRPPTAVRPPNATRVATGMRPGTSGHPGMRVSTPIATPGVLSAQIKMTDRPVIQQGLSGMQTCTKVPQRQILDKSYYLGLLRSKIKEVTTENSTLLKEIDNYNQENSVYLSYEERAAGLAAEIKDLQGQLADCNMVVDKLNTNTEMEEMLSDYNDLKAYNDTEAQSVNKIFTERKEREEAIRALEEEIRKERQVTDEVVQTMPAAKQEKYFAMTTTNEDLLQELSGVQEELGLLMTKKEDYEAELAHSHIKQEMIQLYQTLSALEAKRDGLEAEHKNLGSPQEERERLLKQVKNNNQEITSMETRIIEIRDRTAQVSDQIQQLEQDSEEAQGECQQEYKNLKKKEEEIDQYLESFEKTRAQEQDNMRQSQENIVSFLQHCSRNMLRLHQVDKVTATELRNMEEVLVNKEKEVVQSKSTASGLTTESQRLQQDLEKVQQLEEKITGELSSLKKHVNTMETELVIYRDLEALRHSAKKKKKRLQKEHVLFTLRRDSFRQLLEEMNQEYEDLKTQLQKNQTHAWLANLERKWQHLEQNNFVMQEFIASKSQESDYTSVAKNVFQQLAEYKSLLNSIQSNKS